LGREGHRPRRFPGLGTPFAILSMLFTQNPLPKPAIDSII
jgi:hypothetical protein